MEVPEQLANLLAQLGFARTADGRHWLLEWTDVFLEAPSARLDDGALVTKVELPSGRTASVLSRVDVLLDRLDELQGTGHLSSASRCWPCSEACRMTRWRTSIPVLSTVA